MSDTTTTATDTANARWWFNALAVIKAGAADTGGQLTIVEVTEPPNAAAPLHVHHREDEGFLVLEGRVTLYVGDDAIEAGAGDFGWGPRDIPPQRHQVASAARHVGDPLESAIHPEGAHDRPIVRRRPRDGTTSNVGKTARTRRASMPA